MVAFTVIMTYVGIALLDSMHFRKALENPERPFVAIIGGAITGSMTLVDQIAQNLIQVLAFHVHKRFASAINVKPDMLIKPFYRALNCPCAFADWRSRMSHGAAANRSRSR